MKQFLRTYLFAVAVLAAVVVRLALGVSAYARAALAPDMLAAFRELGIQLFLAVCRGIGADYALGVSMLCIFAALFFMWSVRPLFRRRWLFFAALVVIMFFPAALVLGALVPPGCADIAYAQTLVTFGCLAGVGLRAGGLRTPDPLRLGDRPIWRTVEKTWLRILPWSVAGLAGLGWVWASWGSPWPLLLVAAAAAVTTTVVLAARWSSGRLGAASFGVSLLLALVPLLSMTSVHVAVQSLLSFVR